MATYRILEKPMTGCLAGQGRPRLLRVDETRFERTWDKLVGRWHYLGSAEMVGSRLKYLICLEEIIVGAISFCAAAFRLGPRDRFVGWDGQERKEWLPRLVENNRFLILPWVRMKNLASATLAESLRALKLDWADKYGVVPAMVETFVDGARFDGTCYRAANWIHLGLTQGYGRSRTGFVHHGNKKAIYVYVLDKSLMLKFKPSVDRLADPVEEIEVMINGIPQWCGSLIKQIGVNDISDDDVRQMLAGHISSYTPYLGRKEHHHHFAMMVQGMLSDINRKSIEPIALAFSGPGGVRTLTKFMADAKWDDGAMKAAYQSDLSRLLAGDEGMITGDDTGYPKKGEKSVGVSRQYRGNSGKIDNCQVAPMVGFVNGNGYGIYDWKLYMPQKWFSVEYSDLSKKCKIPEDLVFETKNSLLLDMIKKAHGSGNLRARYVGVDSS
ncbi:MAG: DUF4338 domain-containing protein, partial [Deltaproteobacteria bacterium]|nr:DUF4338 domain-containing protein [Deltaproteobacteria bacterium]